MSLLDLVLNSKDPKKKLNLKPQYRTAAELAGASTYTAPADNTTVATKAIANPKAERYANAPLPKYWDAQGRIHTAYTGKTTTRKDIGKNLLIEDQIKSDNELKAVGDLGVLAGRTLLEPADWALSALEYAKGDINGTEMALSMFPLVSGGLLGLGRLGKELRNMFNIEDIVPEFKTVSGDFSLLSKDKAATERILNHTSNRPYAISNSNDKRRMIRAIRETNGIDNFFQLTPRELVPITLPGREDMLSAIDTWNDAKNGAIVYMNDSRLYPGTQPEIDNFPRLSHMNSSNALGRGLRENTPFGDMLRGDFLQYHDNEIRHVLEDTYGTRLGAFFQSDPDFMKRQKYYIYRNMLSRMLNEPLEATFVRNSTNQSLMDYIDAQENILSLNRGRMHTLASLPPFHISNIPSVGYWGPRSMFGNTHEIRFANRYADLVNEHLKGRGIFDNFITTGLHGNTLEANLHTPNQVDAGVWTMSLNPLAMNKIRTGDFSLQDFPHNSPNPFNDTAVLTMRNTSSANLPPKAGLYSQELMDKIKNEFGIRVGAGRNSQTLNRDYDPNSGKLGSEDIWRNKWIHGKAYVPNNDFTKAISYGILSPFLLKALLRESDDNTR